MPSNNAVPAVALHRDLQLYVQAGLTPAQALQVATWNDAKYSRVLDDSGSIVAGKRADLVLVDGDPTTNTSDIRTVALVIKRGQACYPSDIHDALGIKAVRGAGQVADRVGQVTCQRST